MGKKIWLENFITLLVFLFWRDAAGLRPFFLHVEGFVHNTRFLGGFVHFVLLVLVFLPEDIGDYDDADHDEEDYADCDGDDGRNIFSEVLVNVLVDGSLERSARVAILATLFKFKSVHFLAILTMIFFLFK